MYIVEKCVRLIFNIRIKIDLEFISEIFLQSISVFNVILAYTLLKWLTLKMDVFDPIIHVEFEAIDLLFYIVDLLIFFSDKITDFFVLKFYLSD